MEILWVDSCVFKETGIFSWGLEKTNVQISNVINIFSCFTDDDLHLNLAVPFFLVLN